MSNGFIVLTVVAEPEDGMFVSYCQELGTSSCGDTELEALDNLEEAITVHLAALVEIGDLDRFFQERGVEVQQSPPTHEVNINVPLGSTVKTYSHALNGP